MSQTKKAVYYPSIFYDVTQTPFGALESSRPELYQKPIANRPELKIVEIDALGALGGIWGSNILDNRDILYKVVSGTCPTPELQAILISYYQKFSAFNNYVTHAAYFEDRNVPLLQRIVKPARTQINANIENIKEACRIKGGKLLMVTHDLVYVGFTGEVPDLSEFKKVRVIEC